MNKIQEKLIYVSVAMTTFLPFTAMAQTYQGIGGSVDSLKAVGKASGSKGDLPTMIGNIINVLLGTLGIVFVILVIYAGVLYMTASGDNDKVKKAKTLLTQAVIGMIIIIAAYSISAFVIGQLVGITSGTTAVTPG